MYLLSIQKKKKHPTERNVCKLTNLIYCIYVEKNKYQTQFNTVKKKLYCTKNQQLQSNNCDDGWVYRSR